MNRKELASYLTAGASGPNQFVERDTELAKQDRDAATRQLSADFETDASIPAGDKRDARLFHWALLLAVVTQSNDQFTFPRYYQANRRRRLLRLLIEAAPG